MTPGDLRTVLGRSPTRTAAMIGAAASQRRTSPLCQQVSGGVDRCINDEVEHARIRSALPQKRIIEAAGFAAAALFGSNLMEGLPNAFASSSMAPPLHPSISRIWLEGIMTKLFLWALFSSPTWPSPSCRGRGGGEGGGTFLSKMMAEVRRAPIGSQQVALAELRGQPPGSDGPSWAKARGMATDEHLGRCVEIPWRTSGGGQKRGGRTTTRTLAGAS